MVKSVGFTLDGTSVCSAGSDGVVKLHGLRSGRTLRDFRGHEGEVGVAVFVRRNGASTSTGDAAARLVSGGSDGCVKVWDVKTASCLRTISRESLAAAEASGRQRVSVLTGICSKSRQEHKSMVTQLKLPISLE